MNETFEPKTDQPHGLWIEPIGVIRSVKKLKFDARHQPDHSASEESVIELNAGFNFEQALHDLEGFERIWLLWWFHKNKDWKPKVMPPRGGRTKRGVFATRSPHRPAPIGITAVTLLGVDRRWIVVGSNDLLDGTPILDIKPYLPEADAFPQSAVGWIAEIEAQAGEPAKYRIEYSALADVQIKWLHEREIDFLPRAEELLARDPLPHRTRRITRLGENRYRMGCGAWRLVYSLRGAVVLVERVEPGYPPRSLGPGAEEKVPFADEQRGFYERWPEIGEAPKNSLI